MVKKIFLVGIIVGLTFFLSNRVFATPALGVATDTGIYAYTDPDAMGDEYINYFADTILPAVDEYEGYVLGQSGSYLTIFTTYDPSLTQIYLLADTAGDHLPMTFGGNSLTLDSGYSFIKGQADGYSNRPYSYLGLTDTADYYWKPAPGDFPKEDSKTFYFYKAPITYTGDWTTGYYFFAAAEINAKSGLQFSSSGGPHDKFSPKTASAGGYPVPEPASLVLLGSGLLSLAVAGIRKKKSRV